MWSKETAFKGCFIVYSYVSWCKLFAEDVLFINNKYFLSPIWKPFPEGVFSIIDTNSLSAFWRLFKKGVYSTIDSHSVNCGCSMKTVPRECFLYNWYILFVCSLKIFLEGRCLYNWYILYVKCSQRVYSILSYLLIECMINA